MTSRNTTTHFKKQDQLFRSIIFLFALLVFIMLVGVIAGLVIEASPTFKTFGFSFLTTLEWDVNREIFGAVDSIYGTLMTTFIAMLFAVPISFGLALFLTEMCPTVLRKPLGSALELLAGIPSIIYGIWGLTIFAPFLGSKVFPYLSQTFGHWPLIGQWLQSFGTGNGVFTAGVVLSFMVLPFIASVIRDVFQTVPPVLKESAYGLGCTRWEVVSKIVLPYSFTGVVGAVILGFGRAMGETMAVTFVIGNAHRIGNSVFDPGTSIAATLALEFAEANPGLHTSSLFAMGLLLFLITFMVLSLAKYMINKNKISQGR